MIRLRQATPVQVRQTSRFLAELSAIGLMWLATLCLAIAVHNPETKLVLGWICVGYFVGCLVRTWQFARQYGQLHRGDRA